MYFDNETADYIRNIRKNSILIHDFNYKYILNNKYGLENKDASNYSNILELVNETINSNYCSKNKVGEFYYSLITYIMRSELQFNIEQSIKERYFINLIRKVFFENYFEDWFWSGYSDEELISLVRSFLSELYDVVYIDDFSTLDSLLAIGMRETYKNDVMFLFDSFVSHYVFDKNFNVKNFNFCYTEIEFNNLKTYILSQYHKKKAIEEYKKDKEKQSENNPINISIVGTIGVDSDKKSENTKINYIRTNLSNKQSNYLIDGLIELECIDKESKDDFFAFIGINKTKETINTIEWEKSKMLCAYFVDKFNEVILKRERIMWKPFETLFSQSNLVDSRNHYKNKTGDKPMGYKDIDVLFEKIFKE